MKRPRFTIASLLGIVLFLAVGLAALREASEPWDSGVFGVTLVLLMASVLLCVHRTEGRRAYWLGFAVFGSAYLALSLVPTVAARLPTSKGLAYLDSKVSDRPVSWFVNWATPSPGAGNSAQQGKGVVFVTGGTVTNGQPASLRLWNATTGTAVGATGTTENFVRIGHSLLALMVASVGAHLSRHLQASGRSGRAGGPDVDRSSTTPT